jgi:hypothetical protein
LYSRANSCADTATLKRLNVTAKHFIERTNEMKFFNVEMERKSYVMLFIEAETEEEAHEQALREVQEGGWEVSDDVEWTITYTEENNS